jgi:GNAT superfamily N-acetyltransferase
VVVGDPVDAVAVLAALVPDPDATPFASVPAAAAEPLVRAGWTTRVGWAFRWTDAAPALPVVDGVSWVAGDDEEVRGLLAAAFPDASLQPGNPEVRRWAALRRDGRLVACAADATLVDGLGFLASIASHPDARGTGAGAAVTAWATRELVRAHGRCGLWLMADNVVAAALYTRLGFRDDHPMAVVTRG